MVLCSKIQDAFMWKYGLDLKKHGGIRINKYILVRECLTQLCNVLENQVRSLAPSF
jgi:hypothetical protein